MARRNFQGLRIRKLADKSEGERHVRYLIRAPQIEPDGSVLVDPAAPNVERILWNPATPEVEHEPWPLLGYQIEGTPPKHVRLPTSSLQAWLAEGFATVDEPRWVHRPGGPAEAPFRVTHSFLHCDRVVLHTLEGDVAYRVLENPDKWPAEKEGEIGFGGEVRWYYDLQLEATG